MRPIDERTAFLRAVTFGVDELAEAERIMEWMIEFRTGYNQVQEENRPELQRLMVEAWNNATRA